MTQINFAAFVNAAQRDTSQSHTIKLGGDTGVKYVGWPTWKSTNRAAMSAFYASIQTEYGENVANLVATDWIYPANHTP